MNRYFMRHVILSILTSLFAVSFGVSNIKYVNAQNSKAESKNEPNQVKTDTTKQDCPIPSQLVSEKLKIAIVDFNVSATSSSSEKLNDRTDNVIRIADTVAGNLAKDKNFIVIDRSQIPFDRNRPYNNTSSTKPKINLCEVRKKWGVEAILIGSITYYDVNTRKSKRGFLGFGKESTNTNAEIGIGIRVISTATGEIINFFPGNGQSSSRDRSVLLPKLTLELSDKKHYTNSITTNNNYLDSIRDERGTNFTITINSSQSETVFSSSGREKDSLINLATKQAINKIVDTLNTNRDRLISLIRKPGTKQSTVVGTIGNGEYIVLNRGKAYGYREGMVLVVQEVIQVFVDPTTKEVVRRLTSNLGKVKVIDVDGKSSIAKFISNDRALLLSGESMKKQIQEGRVIAKPVNN